MSSRRRRFPHLPFPASAAAGLLCALFAPGGPARAEEQLVDGIAAQVGTRIVLVSEVLQRVAPQEQAMREAGVPASEIAKLHADGLEDLIEARLLEDIIEKNELYATEEEVNRTIEGIAEENGLTLEQLYASVVFHGLSAEEYREQIKHDLERRTLIRGIVGPKVKVEDEEVEELFRQRFDSQPAGGLDVRVRQILRASGGPTERSQETACAEVGAARERVVAGGETFSDVAREVSDVAPRQGGDLGWLHLDSVASWMKESLEPLEPGGVSDLISLPFGCSILELVDRRSYEPVTFEAVRGSLTRELWETRLQQEYRKWIEELRAKNYIERRGYFAGAAHLGESAFPLEDSPEIEGP